MFQREQREKPEPMPNTSARPLRATWRLSAIPLLAPLGGALFGRVVAPQTRFMDRRGYVGAFDFEERPRLALPEEPRAKRLLKTDFRLVGLIVRRCHADLN
jgi:hypothetical protein